MHRIVLNREVCAVVVTYGDRQDSLVKTINSLNKCGLGKIVIVDNNSGEKTKNYLKNLEKEHRTRFTVIYNSVNMGSAGGFNCGIRSAVAQDFEFMWLLDDDNVPQHNALNILLSHMNGIESERTILCSVKYTKNIHGNRVFNFPPYYPSRSSFCEFNIFDFPRKIFRKLMGNNYCTASSSFGVPYCTYSGLLLTKKAVDECGLPNRSMYLYCDDVEYTFRLTNRGWKINLIKESALEDIGEYWGGGRSIVALFTRFLSDDFPVRARYTARNQAYFDAALWKSNPMIYLINRWSFISFLLFFAIRMNKIDKFRDFILLISLGENKELGKLSSGKTDV